MAGIRCSENMKKLRKHAFFTDERPIMAGKNLETFITFRRLSPAGLIRV
ncbi:MAG: hypothetical protein GX876_02150 [Bacteroidales bacterium]|nr:hypothetical protein [Bacteroidales bacterium]